MTNSNKLKIRLNLNNLFSIGLSILAVGSYPQKPVNGQVCYAQTEEGSTICDSKTLV
jgi:hypothetical protein